MAQVTLHLSDETIRKATMLAAKKGVGLTAFLAHQIDELVAANDRYERAKASVLHMFPDAGELPDMDEAGPANPAQFGQPDELGHPTQFSSPEQFFERWRQRP